jgi:hypothetical protein
LGCSAVTELNGDFVRVPAGWTDSNTEVVAR